MLKNTMVKKKKVSYAALRVKVVFFFQCLCFLTHFNFCGFHHSYIIMIITRVYSQTR